MYPLKIMSLVFLDERISMRNVWKSTSWREHWAPWRKWKLVNFFLTAFFDARFFFPPHLHFHFIFSMLQACPNSGSQSSEFNSDSFSFVHSSIQSHWESKWAIDPGKGLFGWESVGVWNWSRFAASRHQILLHLVTLSQVEQNNLWPFNLDEFIHHPMETGFTPWMTEIS